MLTAVLFSEFPHATVLYLSSSFSLTFFIRNDHQRFPAGVCMAVEEDLLVER